MFAVRGLAVSFSVFVIVYVALSLAVSCTWRRLWFYVQKHPVRRIADLLVRRPHRFPFSLRPRSPRLLLFLLFSCLSRARSTNPLVMFR